MKHSFIYTDLFKVNDTYIAADDIQEAIAIYQECNPEEEITSARKYSGKYDTTLCKVATEEDIYRSFGPEKS